jgi:MauM/NapG family ferredoxin protein
VVQIGRPGHLELVAQHDLAGWHRALGDQVELLLADIVVDVVEPAALDEQAVAPAAAAVAEQDPLGAFLGLLSGYSLLGRSVSEGCTSCGACARVCQGDAVPDIKGGWRDTECYYCMNCDDVCPRNAVHFGFGRTREAAAMDLGRRRVVASVLTGVVSVPLLRSSPLARGGYPNPVLIRPPGSLEEKEFLKRCVKCGECMKVCITNGLQPALFEAGLEGIWSPVLVSRMGYCEYRCTLCGQVCPTGAIPNLALKEKKAAVIGLAVVDKNHCLPYAKKLNCIVCEEHCPIPEKAIRFEEVEETDYTGKKLVLKKPYIVEKLCTGCGICEYVCPVEEKAAVEVFAKQKRKG